MSGRGKGQPRGRKRRAPEDSNDTLNSAVSTTGGNDSNWDPNKPENWTIGELRTRLLEQNIRPPCGFTKTMLVKLYKENNTSVSDGNSDVTPPTENDLTQPGYHSRNLPSNEAMKALQAHVTRLEQLILCQNTVAVGQAPAVPGHVLTATSTTSPTSPTLEPPAVAGGIPNNYVPQPDVLLQQTGISSESLPSIEVVPQAIRQQIIEGKDVNLALLLLPSYDYDCTRYNRFTEVGGRTVPLQTDPRLCKSLTLGEFVKAFSIYRSIMCEYYPNRRQELDIYERDIVELATTYPGSVFYEYHKAFATRAAALLHQRGIKVNWAIRDNQLYTTICSGFRSNSCKLCNNMNHTEDFCPLILNGLGSSAKNHKGNNRNGDSNTDSKGRTRVIHHGKEVCNNYNDQDGCNRDNCPYLHIKKSSIKSAKTHKTNESAKQ
ncbi:hypothetical protein CI610_02804 [invertebrate metagenome]|uniref:C3H1-type domain-containing protein n=1 Tax=invertebrate metagenome TaxID=1711999 RepID=A0A2H9T4V0_9ZZZZ